MLLNEKVGATEADNLIYDLTHPLDAVTVTLAPGQGAYERGTVLGTSDDGASYQIMESGLSPRYILADGIDTDGSDPLVGVAYRTGSFNRNALKTDSYELSVEDEDELRVRGIFLSTEVRVSDAKL